MPEPIPDGNGVSFFRGFITALLLSAVIWVLLACVVGSAWADCDYTPPGGEVWGEDFPVQAVVDLAGPDPSLSRIAFAATVMVSRMKSGPVQEDWPAYLDEGLASCAVRADLAMALVKALAPDAEVRRSGFTGVPKQNSHSTFAVLIDGVWAHFDPSAGLCFTDTGDLDGRFMGIYELLATPGYVNNPGPIVVVGERVDVRPWTLHLGFDLEAVTACVPGWQKENFPLYEMLSTGDGGVNIPTVPWIVHNPMTIPGLTAYGTCDLLISEHITEIIGGDLWVSTMDFIGVSFKALNHWPQYDIDGLEPGKTYALRVYARWTVGEVKLRAKGRGGLRLLTTAWFDLSDFITDETRCEGLRVYYDIVFEAKKETAGLLISHDSVCANNYLRVRAVELVEVHEPETTESLSAPKAQAPVAENGGGGGGCFIECQYE
jgi:hypothetical protein